MEIIKKFKEKGLNIAENHREPAAEAILSVVAGAGRAISSDEITALVDYSDKTVDKWLNMLKREGLLVQNKDKKRVSYTVRGK